jgi:Acetyltransferases
MKQKPRITIRRATPDDAQLLAELGARTFQETFAPENTDEDMAAYVASAFNVSQQTAELTDPASTFLLAEVDDIIAGYAKLHAGAGAEGVEGAKPTELVRLYASQEWIGRGVGQALMQACLDAARSGGYETIWLGVWERNVRARAFYEKYGFRAVGEHVFQLGSDPQRDILMERPIDIERSEGHEQYSCANE